MTEFQELVKRVREIDKDAAYYLNFDARLLPSFCERGFLTSCMNFCETSQGHDYWWDIYRKLSKTSSARPASSPVDCTASNFLDAASKHMSDRAGTYDSPEGERSMGRAVTAFNAITQHELLESEGWLLLQILKDSRQWSTKEYHQDSAEDCVAFSALKGESLYRESRNG